MVTADEDPVEVRRRLDDLGLRDLRFNIDTTRAAETGARVTALPTTYLVGRMGRVRDRLVGYSEVRLQMMIFKLTQAGANGVADVE